MPNIKSSVRSVKTDAERRAANGPVKAEIRSTARNGEQICCCSQKVPFSQESQRSQIRQSKRLTAIRLPVFLLYGSFFRSGFLQGAILHAIMKNNPHAAYAARCF